MSVPSLYFAFIFASEIGPLWAGALRDGAGNYLTALLISAIGLLVSCGGFLLQKAGLTRATGHPGAVTLIQRFGSALNLNIHFHMIFLDGVHLPLEGAVPVFRHVPAPTGTELQELVQQIAARIGRVLEQQG
jgi:Putative transposase